MRTPSSARGGNGRGRIAQQARRPRPRTSWRRGGTRFPRRRPRRGRRRPPGRRVGRRAAASACRASSPGRGAPAGRARARSPGTRARRAPRPRRRRRRARAGARARAGPRRRARRSSRSRAARTTSETIMSRRRSNRSESTPPTSRSRTFGSVHATPTTESAVGAFEKLVHLPRDRDEVDAVADQRHGHPGPEQRRSRGTRAAGRSAAGRCGRARSPVGSGRLLASPSRAASNGASPRRPPGVAAALEVGELADELAVALEAVLGERPGLDGGSTAQPGSVSCAQSLKRHCASRSEMSPKASSTDSTPPQSASLRTPGVSRRSPPPGSATSSRCVVVWRRGRPRGSRRPPGARRRGAGSQGTTCPLPTGRGARPSGSARSRCAARPRPHRSSS